MGEPDLENVTDRVEVTDVAAFGVWSQRQGQAPAPAELRAVEWLQGKDEPMTEELAKDIRTFVLTQVTYRACLENNLREAVSGLRDKATPMIAPMGLPHAQAQVASAARSAALFEASMLAAQDVLDAMNKAQIQVRGAA